MKNSGTSSKTDKLIDRLRGLDKMRILFVCLGNICRSPAAEGVMQSIIDDENANHRFELDSAGTGGYHEGELPDNRMRIHARRRGYELTHRCRKVKPSDFDDFDLIIAMDASNEANLRNMSPTEEGMEKIVRMSEFIDIANRHYDHVPDPYYEGAEGFELVLDLLENGCRNLYELLTDKETTE